MGICHFFRGNIRNLGFYVLCGKLDEIHPRYQEFLNFFLSDKREKYEMNVLCRDKKFWRDLIKHKNDSFQEIDIQHPLVGFIITWFNLCGDLLNCHYFREGSQSKTKYSMGLRGKFGIRKIEIFQGISGYDRFFHRK